MFRSRSRSASSSTVPMTSPDREMSTVPITSPCFTGADTLSGRWKVFWVMLSSAPTGRMVSRSSAG